MVSVNDEPESFLGSLKTFLACPIISAKNSLSPELMVQSCMCSSSLRRHSTTPIVVLWSFWHRCAHLSPSFFTPFNSDSDFRVALHAAYFFVIRKLFSAVFAFWFSAFPRRIFSAAFYPTSAIWNFSKSRNCCQSEASVKRFRFGAFLNRFSGTRNAFPIPFFERVSPFHPRIATRFAFCNFKNALQGHAEMVTISPLKATQ